jgi:hypothetical protein
VLAAVRSFAHKTQRFLVELGNITLYAAAPGLTNSSLDVNQKIEGVIACGGIGYKF